MSRGGQVVQTFGTVTVNSVSRADAALGSTIRDWWAPHWDRNP
jgi:hypothetical protein